MFVRGVWSWLVRSLFGSIAAWRSYAVSAMQPREMSAPILLQFMQYAGWPCFGAKGEVRPLLYEKGKI
jgi:hypothetical protein